MAALLALIRHGPTVWNASGMLQGRADIPLSEAGRDQMRRMALPACLLGAEWRVSPLIRARETAALLAAPPPEAEAPEALIEERLIEMDWGDWEGERVADLRARLGETMRRNEDRGLDFQPPGGESPRQVQDRLAPLLAELAAGPALTIGVTHKGVIRALYALATGWDMRGRPPDRLDWKAAQVFSIAPAAPVALAAPGQVILPHRLNLPLIPEAGL